jgi:aryl-alcohol dehydrogenase-like predicted oxidoreductase
MRYRKLGKTGLNISAIGLGTVELGMDYGIKVPRSYKKPPENVARDIFNEALDNGINMIDTAPAYGDSETLVGKFIGKRPCYIATKVSMPPREKDISKHVYASTIRSLKNIKRDYIDIMQVHHATADIIKNTKIAEILLKLKKEGLIRFIGATVHGTDNAMAIVKAGCFDSLQIAYNLLDQRMLKKVIPESKKQGIGLLGRSAYLKGILTPKMDYLSNEYQLLKNAADNIIIKMGLKNRDDLARIAIRFCITTEDISSVLVGTKSMEYLKFAIDAEKKGSLPAYIFKQLLRLGIKDRYWLDPRNWPA